MSNRKWENLLVGKEEAKKTKVFSGGTCNIATPNGMIRNTGRDLLNNVLNKMGTPFFDPQIHEDTHGREYVYDLDGPAEQLARENAKVLIYEIAPYTLATVTMLEILQDAVSGKKVIVILTGDKNDFNAKGSQMMNFIGVTIAEIDDLKARQALEQAIKTANNARKTLVDMLKKYTNVTILTMPNIDDLTTVLKTVVGK